MDKLNQVAGKNNKLEKYYSLKGNFWSERDYEKTLFNSLKNKGWGNPQNIEAIHVNKIPLEKLLFSNLRWIYFYAFSI